MIKPAHNVRLIRDLCQLGLLSNELLFKHEKPQVWTRKKHQEETRKEFG